MATIISYLEALSKAGQRGLITWESVQERQNRQLPRCVNHNDRPTPARSIDDKPLCAECAIAAAREAKP